MRAKVKPKTVEEKKEYRRKHWVKVNTPPEGCNPCPKGCLECPFPTCEYNGLPSKEESKAVRQVLNKIKPQLQSGTEFINNKTYCVTAIYSKIQWK